MSTPEEVSTVLQPTPPTTGKSSQMGSMSAVPDQATLINMVAHFPEILDIIKNNRQNAHKGRKGRAIHVAPTTNTVVRAVDGKMYTLGVKKDLKDYFIFNSSGSTFYSLPPNGKVISIFHRMRDGNVEIVGVLVDTNGDPQSVVLAKTPWDGTGNRSGIAKALSSQMCTALPPIAGATPMTPPPKPKPPAMTPPVVNPAYIYVRPRPSKPIPGHVALA
jgi:hypothetical protein